MGLNFKKKYLTDVFRELDSKEKKIFSILILLVFFSIFLELFSIALIIPLIKLFTDNSYLDILRLNFSVLKGFDDKTLLIFTVIVFLVAYFLKTIFLSFLTFKKYNFLNDLKTRRIFLLYNTYINQKYSFHRNTHSSILVKNLINEMDVLLGFYSAYLILISESLFAFIIFLAIFIKEPIIFGFLFLTILVIHLIFRFFSKNRLENWSIERQNLQTEQNKIYTETFGAIKEIIIYDVKYFFEKKIQQIQSKRGKLSAKFSSLNDLPRFFLEFFALVFSSLFFHTFFIGVIIKKKFY